MKESPEVINRLQAAVFVIFGLIFIVGLFVWLVQARQKYSKNESILTNKIVITGVVRTSGLSEDEKSQLNLLGLDYQLTDFGGKNDTGFSGFYLESPALALDTFLGKCVQVTGTVPKNRENTTLQTDAQNSYSRIPLSVFELKQLDNSQCNPYPLAQSAVSQEEEKLTMRGKIVQGKRPAPDINYDYRVILATPFIDEENGSGLPQKVTTVDVIPSNDAIWMELEKYINAPIEGNGQVELEGYMRWGYAESKYFEVTAVKQ